MLGGALSIEPLVQRIHEALQQLRRHTPAECRLPTQLHALLPPLATLSAQALCCRLTRDATLLAALRAHAYSFSSEAGDELPAGAALVIQLLDSATLLRLFCDLAGELEGPFDGGDGHAFLREVLYNSCLCLYLSIYLYTTAWAGAVSRSQPRA